MALTKVALFLALNLGLIAIVHGNPPMVPTPPLVPTPPIAPTPSNGGSCPINPLKITVCSNVLLLLKLRINVLETEQCCPLLSGLADLDAAVCVCTAIKANLLGLIDVDIPVDLTLLLNHCNKTYPSRFTCSP
ncbi:Cortical cell-delineating protein [Triticum urartu]|uniref:Cortical cell-delineating protein n=1 Tax=Triticum urartu TaxID=4572 RepID=M7ZHB1_TRIUA|nr:cortical cell-delineating protein-like [Triticum urartu]EMS59477.1 Cortical cell-delineating protein [Triticum urartu]